MSRDGMQQFPLGERNVVNDGLLVFKELPQGVTEFKASVPRQATGSGGRRFTYCGPCGGWIPAAPFMQNRSQNATPFIAGEFNTAIYRCVRCGRPLDTGPTGGKESTNKSGIGLAGQLRPS